jgi:template-activating factor I
LKKEYKYIAPPAAAGESPDADGITDSMLDFSWERDVVASVSSISL